jgi:hypothetical protein
MRKNRNKKRKKGRITFNVKDADAPSHRKLILIRIQAFLVNPDPNTRFRASVFMSKKLKNEAKTKNFVKTKLHSGKDSTKK